MAAVYPFGYAGAMRTMEQTAATTTVQRLHPEVWRRMSALMQAAAAANVQLGVGTGWRKQPTDKPGFAAPGNSYHEGFMPGGTTRPDGVNDRNAMAIDTVLSSAWPWMNANCGRFGFVHFANVNNEPWHIQPVEIPRSRNFATREPPLKTWPLPDGTGGTDGDDFMTPEDKAYLDAKFAAIWSQQLPALGTAVGAAAAWAALQDARVFARAASNQAAVAAAQTDTVEATLASIDPAKLEQAITDAVTAALNDVSVNADLSAADIALIATASAAATVAEIAS